jgi:intracellular multiplication protein IcmG
MVDNDHTNDEYQLDDLDLLAAEPEAQLQPEPVEQVAQEERAPFVMTQMLRNGLIVVGSLILLVFFYKFIGSFKSGNKLAAQEQIIPVAETKSMPFNNIPVQNAALGTTEEPHLSNKLSMLGEDQKNMGLNVAAINNQLSSVSSMMTDMSNKVVALNGMLSTLNDKVDSQSKEIERLITLQQSTKHKAIRSSRLSRTSIPANVFSLQAVIPGRAWIIAQNGTTMTVREGTVIAGYGVVKLIDSKQGRVVTSSGHIIRFSQSDS